MLTLYEHPLSPYARKVKLALWEKGLPFESRKVDLFGEIPADFARTSPRLEVPSLVDEGVSIFDSTIILEYIEDRYPEPPLRPSDPAGRARARMLEDIADTQLDATLWALAEIRFFGVATGAKAEEMTAAAGAAIAKNFDRLEWELTGCSYLNGAAFGWADIALIPHVTAAEFFDFRPGVQRPRLSDWLSRVMERESVQRDQAEAMAAVSTFGSGAGGRRPILRQFRDHRLEWMVKHGGLDVVIEGVRQGTIKFSPDV